MTWYWSVQAIDGIRWDPPFDVDIDPVAASTQPRDTSHGRTWGAPGDDDPFGGSVLSPSLERQLGDHTDEPGISAADLVQALLLPGTAADYVRAVGSVERLGRDGDGQADDTLALSLLELGMQLAESSADLQDDHRPRDLDATRRALFDNAIRWWLRRGCLLEAEAADRRREQLGLGVDHFGPQPSALRAALRELHEAVA